MCRHYILVGREVRAVKDVIGWAQWYETADRTVARTKIGDVEVSTVFLGLDHNWGPGPPLLFETLIFGGLQDHVQFRYSTWAEAQAGHARAVEMAKSPNGAVTGPDGR